VLLLVAATLGSFWHVVQSDEIGPWMGCGDSHWYFGPQQFFLDSAMAQGELPLWNPLTFCGQPFAANPQAAVFYPLNLIRSVLTTEPSPLATHLSLAWLDLGHILIMGLGCFALARSQQLSTSASLVAALSFALSASVIRRACSHQFLSVVCWLPWLLLLTGSWTAKQSLRPRLRSVTIAAGLFGLILLGGFPQLSIYVGIAWLTVLLLRRALSPSCLRLRGWFSDVASVALVTLLALLFAAPLLLPAREFAAASARLDDSQEKLGQLAVLSQHEDPQRFLDAMVNYAGDQNLIYGFRGCGAGVLLLAALGLLHSSRRRVVVYVGLLYVLLDCSFGPPFPVATVAGALAPLQLINPSRCFLVACLPLGMLAGFGVDALRGSLSHWRRAGCLLVALLAGGWILRRLWSVIEVDHFLSPHPWLLATPVLVLLATIAAAVARRMWILALLPMLVAIEIVWWNQALVPYLLQTRPFRGDPGDWTAQTLPLDNQRQSEAARNQLMYRLQPVMNGYDPLHLARPRLLLCSPEQAVQASLLALSTMGRRQASRQKSLVPGGDDRLSDQARPAERTFRGETQATEQLPVADDCSPRPR
jgi:hypothetical protein